VCGLLQLGLNEQVGQQTLMSATDVSRHCDLVDLETYDKQSNSSRTTVESKSSRNCNHRPTLYGLSHYTYAYTGEILRSER